MPGVKKPSTRKSLTRSQFYDAVIEKLEKEYDYEEGMKRTQIRDILNATVDVAATNSPRARGCTIPGLGKLYWRLRKAQKAGKGINRFTGEEMDVKARPAEWRPKFRLMKAGKDLMTLVQPKA